MGTKKHLWKICPTGSYYVKTRSWPGFWITLTRVGISLVLTMITIRIYSLSIWYVWISIVIGSVIASNFGLAWVNRALASTKSEEAPPSYVLEAEEVLPPPIG